MLCGICLELWRFALVMTLFCERNVTVACCAPGLELSQRELVAMAFAGDDVQAEFAADKAAEAEAEAPKEDLPSQLPGWGAWAAQQRKPGWLADTEAKAARWGVVKLLQGEKTYCRGFAHPVANTHLRLLFHRACAHAAHSVMLTTICTSGRLHLPHISVSRMPECHAFAVHTCIVHVLMELVGAVALHVKTCGGGCRPGGCQICA